MRTSPDFFTLIRISISIFSALTRIPVVPSSKQTFVPAREI